MTLYIIIVMVMVLAMLMAYFPDTSERLMYSDFLFPED